MKREEIKFKEIMKWSLLVLSIIGVSFSLYFAITNILYPKAINVVLVIPFIFFLFPYLILSLYDVRKIDAKMQVVPRFLRDVVDNVESGMDLISSIKTTTRNEYSSLNEDIIKLVNQLSWGISFEEAFLKFADNIGSKDLRRDFILVIEARKVGGHVEKILRELSLKISLDNLRKKERKTNLASTIFTGYISFVIFIFIIVIVYNSLFLSIATKLSSNQNQVLTESNNSKMNSFLSLLILLSYELAILSGFLFGLMQNNEIISGAPHVLLLVVITFIGFFFFIH